MSRASLALMAGLALLGHPAWAKECRATDTALRVRGALQPGCAAAAATAPRPRDEALRAGRTPGFLDLGNGTEIRISGRVRAETVLRRSRR